MNTALLEVVEGWTGALPFTLNEDGEAADLTSKTVSIILKDVYGTYIADTTAGISITGTTSGQLEYSPSSGAFVAAATPYRIRFQTVNGSGKVEFFPNEDEDVIKVNPR